MGRTMVTDVLIFEKVGSEARRVNKSTEPAAVRQATAVIDLETSTLHVADVIRTGLSWAGVPDNNDDVAGPVYEYISIRPTFDRDTGEISGAISKCERA